MQDLFAKVQAVDADLVFPPLAPHAHFSRFQDSPGFAVFPRGLQGDITLGVSVKHPEEVVVGAGHDDAERQRGNGATECCGERAVTRPHGAFLKHAPPLCAC